MYSAYCQDIKDSITIYDVKPIRIKNKSCGITYYPSFINFSDTDGRIHCIKKFFGNEDGKICVFIGDMWYSDGNILARRNGIDGDIELYDYKKHDVFYDEFIDGYDVLVNNMNVILRMLDNGKKNISEEEINRKLKIKKKLQSILEQRKHDGSKL